MLPIIIQTSNINESIIGRNRRIINGVPQLVFLVNRIMAYAGNGNVIVATSDSDKDDDIVEILKPLNVSIFRGNQRDILHRLIDTAEYYGFDNFVRVFGNYPLVDLDEMDKIASAHIEGDYDYSYNEHRNGILWGTGCEVFRTQTLVKLKDELKNDSQREQVSFYLQQNAARYKVLKKDVIHKRPSYKLNFETEKDLRLIQEIVQNVREIKNEDIISYLDAHKIIANYNVEAGAKEVGIEKLFLHSGKVKDILEEGVYTKSYPISVELTLTNKCNLKCIYCSDQDLRQRQGEDNYLDLGVLDRLFGDLEKGGTKGVVLEGGGEPTLHPDFEKIVCSAKKHNLGIGLITNGTVCIKEDVLHNFEWVRVSLDASNADEYLHLKKVDCFERVIANIAHYAKYCKTVGVGYVVTNNNMFNIETLIMRLRELGVAYVQLRPVVDMPELLPKEGDLKYLEFYRGSNFNVIVDGMSENMEVGNDNLPCYASSITSVISGDGSVYLCGRLNIYNWIPAIGNIKEQSFYEIWSGEERKRQLKMIGDADFCKRNCPQCRVSKFNSLFNRLNHTNSVHFI